MAAVKGRVVGGSSRAGGPAQAEQAEAEDTGDKRVRVILPSWRVAEFRIPRVREAMKIREDALIAAGVDPSQIHDEASRTRAMVRVSNAMEQVALRTLLVGVTSRPVEAVYAPTFNEQLLRARFEREAAEAAAAGQKPLDVEARLAAERDAAVDERATAKSITIDPLTDLDWDEDRGVLGRLGNAYEGTEEAKDWAELHGFAGKLIAGLKALESAAGRSDTPKADRRPTRRSGSFVT